MHPGTHVLQLFNPPSPFFTSPSQLYVASITRQYKACTCCKECVNITYSFRPSVYHTQKSSCRRFCCLYDDNVLSITQSTNKISTWQHDINKIRSTRSKQHQFDELALRYIGYTHKTHFSTDQRFSLPFLAYSNV